MFVGDYHTHTRFSDGRGSVMENALAAKARGLSEVAVTDHGFHVLPKGGEKYLRTKELCREAEERTGIKVIAGVEADVVSLDGEVDVPADIPVDFLVVGFHKFAPPRDAAAFFRMYLATYFCGLIPTGKRARERNTRAVIAAIRRYPVKVVAHLNHSLRVDVGAIARVCAEKGVLVELNAKHVVALKGWWRELVESGVKFVVSSDAHKPSDVGRLQATFDYAVERGVSPDRIVNYCGE